MMADKHGDFVWYELMTTDANAAQAFYGPLLGWSFADSGQEGVDYRVFSAGDTQVGGVLELDAEMIEGGARPAWFGYVRVDDVPAAVAKVRAAGGGVMVKGHEVPGVGPFALLSDPHGAAFYVIDDRSGQDSGAFARYEPQEGCCAWNELYAGDAEQAKAFYGDLFGWSKADEMDMGPMGKYEFLQAGDYTLGALMPKPEQMPMPAWVYYFRVSDIDLAIAYTAESGGQVLVGPEEVPGGEFVMQGLDPQGAMFALIGRKGN